MIGILPGVAMLMSALLIVAAFGDYARFRPRWGYVVLVFVLQSFGAFLALTLFWVAIMAGLAPQ